MKAKTSCLKKAAKFLSKEDMDLLMKEAQKFEKDRKMDSNEAMLAAANEALGDAQDRFESVVETVIQTSPELEASLQAYWNDTLVAPVEKTGGLELNGLYAEPFNEQIALQNRARGTDFRVHAVKRNGVIEIIPYATHGRQDLFPSFIRDNFVRSLESEALTALNKAKDKIQDNEFFGVDVVIGADGKPFVTEFNPTTYGPEAETYGVVGQSGYMDNEYIQAATYSHLKGRVPAFVLAARKIMRDEIQRAAFEKGASSIANDINLLFNSASDQAQFAEELLKTYGEKISDFTSELWNAFTESAGAVTQKIVDTIQRIIDTIRFTPVDPNVSPVNKPTMDNAKAATAKATTVARGKTSKNATKEPGEKPEAASFARKPKPSGVQNIFKNTGAKKVSGNFIRDQFGVVPDKGQGGQIVNDDVYHLDDGSYATEKDLTTKSIVRQGSDYGFLTGNQKDSGFGFAFEQVVFFGDRASFYAAPQAINKLSDVGVPIINVNYTQDQRYSTSSPSTKTENVTGYINDLKSFASNSKMKLKMNVQRVFDIFGERMYNADIGNVIIKELSQNSFDAVKASIEQGHIKSGEGIVQVTQSSNNENEQFVISVEDNGIGMNKKILQDALFTLGGTNKETKKSSGGFGVAKIAMFMAAQRIVIKTTRDGVTHYLDLTADQIKNSEFDVDSETTGLQSGTKITLYLPKEKDGKAISAYGPENLILSEDVTALASYRDPETFPSIAEQIQTDDVRGADHGSIKPSDLIKAGYLVKRISNQEGSAIIYYKKTPNKKKDGTKTYNYELPITKRNGLIDNVDLKKSGYYVYSNGLLQFQKDGIPINPQELWGDKLNYSILMDIDASEDPSSTLYPFTNSREGFQKTSEMAADLGGFIDELRKKEAIDSFNREFTVLTDSETGGPPVDKHQPVTYNNTTIKLTDAGSQFMKGISKVVFDVSDLLLRTLKENYDFIGRDTVGSGAVSFLEIPDRGDNSYTNHKEEDDFFFGAGISKNWGGVNTRIAPRVILVNPFYNKNILDLIDHPRFFEFYSSHFYHIVLHEINHIQQRNEGAGFTWSLSNAEAALSANPEVKAEAIGLIAKYMQDNIDTFKQIYEDYKGSDVLDAESEVGGNSARKIREIDGVGANTSDGRGIEGDFNEGNRGSQKRNVTFGELNNRKININSFSKNQSNQDLIINQAVETHIEPELRILFKRYKTAQDKMPESEDRMQTRGSRSATTRAYKNLYNKYAELHPEDKMSQGLINQMMKANNEIRKNSEQVDDVSYSKSMDPPDPALLKVLPPPRNLRKKQIQQLKDLKAHKIDDKFDSNTSALLRAVKLLKPSRIANLPPVDQDRIWKLVSNIYEARSKKVRNPQARVNVKELLAELESYQHTIDTTYIEHQIKNLDGVYDMGDVEFNGDIKKFQDYLDELHKRDQDFQLLKDSINAKRKATYEKKMAAWRKQFMQVRAKLLEMFPSAEEYLAEYEANEGKKVPGKSLREFLLMHFDYLTNIADVSAMEGNEMFLHFFAINNLLDQSFMYGGETTAKYIANIRDSQLDLVALEKMFRDPVINQGTGFFGGFDAMQRATEIAQSQLDRWSPFIQGKKFLEEDLMGPLLESIRIESQNDEATALREYDELKKKFEEIVGRDFNGEDAVAMAITSRLIQYEYGKDGNKEFLNNIKNELQNIANIVGDETQKIKGAGSASQQRDYRRAVIPVFEKLVAGLTDTPNPMEMFVININSRLGLGDTEVGKARHDLLNQMQTIMERFTLSNKVISELFYKKPFREYVNYLPNYVIPINPEQFVAGGEIADEIEKMDNLEWQTNSLTTEPGQVNTRKGIGKKGHYTNNIEFIFSRGVHVNTLTASTTPERFILNARLKGKVLKDLINGSDNSYRVDQLQHWARTVMAHAMHSGNPLGAVGVAIKYVTEGFARVALSGFHQGLTQTISGYTDYQIRTGNIVGAMQSAGYYIMHKEEMDNFFRDNAAWIDKRSFMGEQDIDRRRNPTFDDDAILNSPFVKKLTKIHEKAGEIITYSLRKGDDFTARSLILAEYARLIGEKNPLVKSIEDVDFTVVEGRLLSQAISNIERNINASNKATRGEFFVDRKRLVSTIRNVTVAFSSHILMLSAQFNIAARDLVDLHNQGGSSADKMLAIRTLGAILGQTFMFSSSRYVINGALAMGMIAMMRDLFDDEEGKIAELEEKVRYAKDIGNDKLQEQMEFELKMAKAVAKQIDTFKQRSLSFEGYWKSAVKDELGAMHFMFNGPGIPQRIIFPTFDRFGEMLMKEDQKERVTGIKRRIKALNEQGKYQQVARLEEELMFAENQEYMPWHVERYDSSGLGGISGAALDGIYKSIGEFNDAAFGLGEININDFMISAQAMGIGQADLNRWFKFMDKIEEEEFKNSKDREEQTKARREEIAEKRRAMENAIDEDRVLQSILNE